MKLHADKHERLLQIDSMILMGMVKYSQSSQNIKFAMSLQYLRKEVKDEVDFLHAEKWSWFFACRKTSKCPKILFQHFGHQSFLQDWYYH